MRLKRKAKKISIKELTVVTNNFINNLINPINASIITNSKELHSIYINFDGINYLSVELIVMLTRLSGNIVNYK